MGHGVRSLQILASGTLVKSSTGCATPIQSSLPPRLRSDHSDQAAGISGNHDDLAVGAADFSSWILVLRRPAPSRGPDEVNATAHPTPVGPRNTADAKPRNRAGRAS